MNGNWRTNLGGALSSLGTALVGIGVVPQLGGVPSKVLTYIAVSGFALSALGKFFTALFSADSKALADLKAQVNENTSAVSELRGNTPAPVVKPQ